MTTSFRSCE